MVEWLLAGKVGKQVFSVEWALSEKIEGLEFFVQLPASERLLAPYVERVGKTAQKLYFFHVLYGEYSLTPWNPPRGKISRCFYYVFLIYHVKYWNFRLGFLALLLIGQTEPVTKQSLAIAVTMYLKFIYSIYKTSQTGARVRYIALC
jgi:hypothetical protein